MESFRCQELRENIKKLTLLNCVYPYAFPAGCIHGPQIQDLQDKASVVHPNTKQVCR